MGTSRLFTLLLVSCLVAVELTGRLAATDMGDGITFLLVLMLAVMVAVRHRTMEMPWVTRGFGWLRRNGESILRWRPEFGIDHRNEPKWRSGVPIPWSRWIVPGLGLALVALGLTLTGASPDGLRNAARTVSTVVWSVGLGLVWSILAMAILAMALASVLYLIPGVATYLARGRSTANHTLRAGGILALVLFLPLGLASALIAPAWAALGVVLAAAVARPFLRFTPSPTLDILFRDRRGEVLAIEWRELAWRSSALFVVVVLVLGALTVGDSITKDLGHALTTTTPVTRGLGVLFLWVACGASCVSHGAMIHAVVIGRRHDPRRVLPQRVCVREAPSEAEFLRLRDGLQRAGFEVLAPTATHTPGEVVIDVVSLRSCTTLAIRGGRVEAPENIDMSTLAAAVHRRHERQCRRQALKRTRRLFREIRKTMGRSGEALVFAPHLWHMTAIQRDDSDVDGDETHY
ncbi:MAG: hypothetical protein KDB53_09755, partial [Planctomycetes bacterium]|nr:hypothetical protein [Planctomycetota bacterium]